MGDRGGGVGIVDKLRGLGPQGDGAIPRPPTNLMAGGVGGEVAPQQGFLREMLMNKGAGAPRPPMNDVATRVDSPRIQPFTDQALPPIVPQAPVNTLLPTQETDPYEIWKAGGRKGQRPPGT